MKMHDLSPHLKSTYNLQNLTKFRKMVIFYFATGMRVGDAGCFNVNLIFVSV